MAVVNTYSTPATNHKSANNEKNPTTATEGVTYTSSATVAVAAADDDGSKFYMLPVFSSWSIKHIWVYNDAIADATAYDVGLYTTAATPVAVDADCYATDVTMASARTTAPIDAAYEARNITAVNQRVYQDGSVTTDPGVWYWLTLTADTVGSAAGDITVIVEYTT